MKRVMIATGGTGGHIYPALVTARALRGRDCDVVFVGMLGASAQALREEGFVCVPIMVQGFVSRGVFQKVLAGAYMAAAIIRCIGIVVRMKPRAILGFGGYSSFPVVLAGVFCRVPTMLHEQNAMPGQANRVLARFVPRIAVGFKDALKFFRPAKVVWTGNPCRAFDTTIPRGRARETFGLAPERTTILVFGGSQGSRAINDHAVSALALPSASAWQVIHVTGRHDVEAVRERYRQAGVMAHVCAYMERMDMAYAAADLVVGRAGAGTVTELGIRGLAAVLIPYPGAQDHQKHNAAVLARSGAAVIIEEKSLRGDILHDKIFSQLAHKGRTDLQRLKEEFVSDGGERLSAELLSLVHE